MTNPIPVATGAAVARPVRRLIAMGVDVAVILVWAAALAVVAVLLRTTEFALTPAGWDLVALLTLVGPVTVFFAFQEASPDQATFGKRLLGLCVVTAIGGRLSFARALSRSVVKFLPWQLAHSAVFRLASGSTDVAFLIVAVVAQVIVLVSVLMMVLDGHHRALHDRLIGTRVVAVPLPTPG